MRLFIDTDVILDVLLQRAPHYTASARILDWGEQNPGKLAVSWHGLANIHYISKDGAESFIQDLLRFTEIPITGTEHMQSALDLKFRDLEDAMQVSAAQLFNAQIIVTRNLKDFKNSPIKAMSPDQCLSFLK